MPRRLVVTAEASKLYSRKVRWSAYKRQVCKWLIDTLQLELHAYEIAGQLEGQCVFISSYRGAQITGWVCTFDDKISVCVTSIRFSDGDGWRPGGGPRKPNFANLEIISGSSIRGDGRCWEIEQEYGDDVIGAPGPLNGKLKEPTQIAVVGDVHARGDAGTSHAVVELRNFERLTASIVEKIGTVTRLLALIHARLNGSSAMREKLNSCASENELSMLARQVWMCRALLSKWFDASKGFGFIASGSAAPTITSRVAIGPRHGRLFISYRRSASANVDHGRQPAPLSMLERIMLAELVQGVKDVERAWIETAGWSSERPEALYLLSVLAIDVSEVLAGNSRCAGDESTINETNGYLPDSAAVDIAGTGSGKSSHGPTLH